MKILYWKNIEKAYRKRHKTRVSKKIQEIRDFFNKPTALSIGAFDGPHLGHEKLFDTVLAEKKDGFLAGLVSFIQSPKMRSKKNFQGEISSLRLRTSFFEEKNFDFIILIDFSPKFSRMEGKLFLSILFFVSKTKFLAIGPDFRCGFQGRTGLKEIASLVKEKGIHLEVLDEFLVSGLGARSTKIREAVYVGDFETAQILLGRAYIFDLVSARKGKKIGLKKNVWQISAGKIRQVLPPEGSYRVKAHFADGSFLFASCIREAHFLRLELHEDNTENVVAISFGYR
jgi:FAD synthase